jgi:hypothetical protein
MNYVCPVCFFTRLPYPPASYHICPCCGTEFGNDDAEYSHQQLREMWVAGGANWFFGRPAPGWNPWLQLIQAKQTELLPDWHVTSVRFQINARVQQASGPTKDLPGNLPVCLQLSV